MGRESVSGDNATRGSDLKRSGAIGWVGSVCSFALAALVGLVPAAVYAQAVGIYDEYQGDMTGALQACTTAAYSTNNCNSAGTISGASCSGCGMAGTVPGTATCQATERSYISSRPGYCFSLVSTTAVAWVYPTTSCPTGTTFLGSGAGDCVSNALRDAASASASYAGFAGALDMGGAGVKVGAGATMGRINVRTGGSFWVEQDFAGGEGVPELTRYYNSVVLDDRAGMGFWMDAQPLQAPEFPDAWRGSSLASGRSSGQVRSRC